jgi:hypothetical protein
VQGSNYDLQSIILITHNKEELPHMHLCQLICKIALNANFILFYFFMRLKVGRRMSPETLKESAHRWGMGEGREGGENGIKGINI